MSYARTVKFITSGAEQNILDIEEVKEVVMEMTGCETDEEYETMKSQGIIMTIDIFTKNTRIKVNDGLYNDLVENVVYSTENMTRIHSIKAEADAVSGTITFRMRGDQ